MPSRLLDRKSTRLNSSHLVISYAVFCLKKEREESAAAPAALLVRVWRAGRRGRAYAASHSLRRAAHRVAVRCFALFFIFFQNAAPPRLPPPPPQPAGCLP